MTICIYGLSQAELARRLAPRIQLDAYAPFPSPREHRAPWGLNRIPQDFRDLTEEGWTEKLEPGEEPPAAPAPGAPTPAPAPSPPRPSAPRTIACPQQLAWTLSHDVAGHAAGFHASFTDPIPFPFRIVAVTAMVDPTTTGVLSWDIRLAQAGGGGDVSTLPQGDPIIRPRQPISADGTLSNALAYLAFNSTGSTRTINTQTIITALAGREIHDTNRRLAFVVGASAAQTIRARVHITIEEICAQPIEARATGAVVARAAAAPRAPVPVTVAGTSPPRPFIIPGHPGPADFARANAARAAGQEVITYNTAVLRGLAPGHTNPGAIPVSGGVAAGVTVQRWALPDQPGRTFATLAEANVAYQAAQAAALPAAQRTAAQAAAAAAQTELIYGAFETPTPAATLLATPGARVMPGVTAPAIRAA